MRNLVLFGWGTSSGQEGTVKGSQNLKNETLWGLCVIISSAIKCFTNGREWRHLERGWKKEDKVTPSHSFSNKDLIFHSRSNLMPPMFRTWWTHLYFIHVQTSESTCARRDTPQGLFMLLRLTDESFSPLLDKIRLIMLHKQHEQSFHMVNTGGNRYSNMTSHAQTWLKYPFSSAIFGT